MSALFRAELSNLQRLVARHAAEQTANTNERERMRTHIKQRVTRLQVPCKRLAKNNRATILQTLAHGGKSGSALAALMCRTRPSVPSSIHCLIAASPG